MVSTGDSTQHTADGTNTSNGIRDKLSETYCLSKNNLATVKRIIADESSNGNPDDILKYANDRFSLHADAPQAPKTTTGGCTPERSTDTSSKKSPARPTAKDTQPTSSFDKQYPTLAYYASHEGDNDFYQRMSQFSKDHPNEAHILDKLLKERLQGKGGEDVGQGMGAIAKDLLKSGMDKAAVTKLMAELTRFLLLMHNPQHLGQNLNPAWELPGFLKSFADAYNRALGVKAGERGALDPDALWHEVAPWGTVAAWDAWQWLKHHA